MIMALIITIAVIVSLALVFWGLETAAYAEASINRNRLVRFRAQNPNKWTGKEQIWLEYFEKEIKKRSWANTLNMKIAGIFGR